MKLLGREIKAIPVPARVRVVVLIAGAPLLQEEVKPEAAREFARELLAAADAAERLAGGQQ